MSDDIEEIKRSVGDVREWLKDQRFTDDDREPDSNINISIQQLNRALALMMVVEMEIERLRAERDEAIKQSEDARRRLRDACAEIARIEARFYDALTPQQIAERNGWDCFKEEDEE